MFSNDELTIKLKLRPLRVALSTLVVVVSSFIKYWDLWRVDSQTGLFNYGTEFGFLTALAIECLLLALILIGSKYQRRVVLIYSLSAGLFGGTLWLHDWLKWTNSPSISWGGALMYGARPLVIGVICCAVSLGVFATVGLIKKTQHRHT